MTTIALQAHRLKLLHISHYNQVPTHVVMSEADFNNLVHEMKWSGVKDPGVIRFAHDLYRQTPRVADMDILIYPLRQHHDMRVICDIALGR